MNDELERAMDWLRNAHPANVNDAKARIRETVEAMCIKLTAAMLLIETVREALEEAADAGDDIGKRIDLGVTPLRSHAAGGKSKAIAEAIMRKRGWLDE